MEWESFPGNVSVQRLCYALFFFWLVRATIVLCPFGWYICMDVAVLWWINLFQILICWIFNCWASALHLLIAVLWEVIAAFPSLLKLIKQNIGENLYRFDSNLRGTFQSRLNMSDGWFHTNSALRDFHSNRMVPF